MYWQGYITGVEGSMTKGKLLFRADQRGPSSLYRKPLDEILSQPPPLILAPENRPEFIRGPIPIPWVQFAAKISPAAAYLGIVAWHVARLRKGKVSFTSSLSLKYGVHPKTARRLLRSLESAGLVRVERARGKAPKVSIVDSTSRVSA
jgi:hypothetical protein